MKTRNLIATLMMAVTLASCTTPLEEMSFEAKFGRMLFILVAADYLTDEIIGDPTKPSPRR